DRDLLLVVAFGALPRDDAVLPGVPGAHHELAVEAALRQGAAFVVAGVADRAEPTVMVKNGDRPAVELEDGGDLKEELGLVAEAPTVLAVGDLHVENFGTWRDAEGRLVWGVNDFDEAWPVPYTNDLVRLATSALVAREYHDLKIDGKEAVGAILDGYREALERGGHAFVLAEHHTALREMALYRL